MLLLITSLTALQACGIVFLVAGVRNNARSVLSDTAAIGGFLDIACGCLGIDGVKQHDSGR